MTEITSVKRETLVLINLHPNTGPLSVSSSALWKPQNGLERNPWWNVRPLKVFCFANDDAADTVTTLLELQRFFSGQKGDVPHLGLHFAVCTSVYNQLVYIWKCKQLIHLKVITLLSWKQDRTPAVMKGTEL